MKVIFDYSRQRDIRVLLTKGKSSINSPNATEAYRQLAALCGENPTEEETGAFIDKYFSENNIDIDDAVTSYQKEWDAIAGEYQKIAEAIFDVSLPQDITAYLTINQRCPYSIEDNLFYVAVPTFSMKRTVMHELWHFYTWYGLGPTEQERLGKEKYNDLKEALTVLLNLECADLLGEDAADKGYPQHAELREDIINFWKKEKGIKRLWEYLTQTAT